VAPTEDLIVVLRKFNDLANLVLQRYPKFTSDQHSLRKTLQEVNDLISRYLQMIQDDDYFRSVTGSSWLPSRIEFDSGGVITTELNRNDECKERLLRELSLILSVTTKKDKPKSTMSLSQITDAASLILRDHFSRQLRALRLWEQIKKREGID